MTLLTDCEWRTSYRHEDGDLVELIYNPALACAVQYDRMTGYFSAVAAKRMNPSKHEGGNALETCGSPVYAIS